ncbi:HAD-IC family P-type ATPase [Pseudonocardia sp. NPDC049154]|uniref:HAD-IC family P-type ATPase n=1 Tax=Pseudonocardia sp. NPDC049154 TaxID=3155501 RepID=UPI0033DE79D7
MLEQVAGGAGHDRTEQGLVVGVRGEHQAGRRRLHIVGAILLRDPLRRHAPRTLRRLRAAGMARLIMLTGDRSEPAHEIGAVLGLDDVLAEQSPADKVAAVRAEQRHAVTVMVGDGVNDAPALAAATVGMAMGARGASASSEAADVVLTSDRLDRLADAMEIARRSRRIAVQSAVAGMGLSLLAMVIAALGMLAPAAGALLQEGIDVAVILNASRALRRPGTQTELAVEQLVESRVGARGATLVDFVGHARADLLRFLRSPGISGQCLDEVVALAGERIKAGIDPYARGPARKLLDLAAGAASLGSWHGADVAPGGSTTSSAPAAGSEPATL